MSDKKTVQGYPERQVSQKYFKRLLAGLTPEAKQTMKEVFLDDYKIRQDKKGTMDWTKADPKRKKK